MNDDELDRNLARARERTLERTSLESLQQLGRLARAEVEAESDWIAAPRRPDAARAVPAVRTVRPQRTPTVRRTRLGWGFGLAAAALVLTAGTTATAYYLGLPPFISLDPGATRAAESIPLEYETTNGIDIRCRMFLEFKGVDAAGVGAVDAAIRTEDWSGFGQGVYNSAGAPPDAPPLAESLNPQDAVADAATDAVFSFAATAIPGLTRFGDSDSVGEPMLSSVLTTCVPDAQ